MNSNVVKINEQEISVKLYNGQRVVTFKDIDNVHERAEGTARKRFNDNRVHFINGTDFYQISEPSEIRTLGIERPQGGTPDKVTLVTESGYLMLVKSFTDDLAWEVQRQLVNNYFKMQSQSDHTCQYPLPAATFEGVANLGRLMERTMKTEGSYPHEIAITLKMLCQQAGIELPECFVKPPTYEQINMTADGSRNLFLCENKKTGRF